MPDLQPNALPPPRPWWRIPLRLLLVILAMTAGGWALNRIAHHLEESGQPADFTRGLIQGALMPCAWPNLLVGNDVTIYSGNNTGLTYKLGYSLGVNACGVVFFGSFFWRVSKWRKALIKREV